MKTLAIIPARGGSKRIPRKNIKDFLGKPIIAYAIDTAIKSGLFDEVMVSTDDDEIAEIAREHGAKVPFLRSNINSNDHATTVDVLIEVLDYYKNMNICFKYACCIYPTSPLLTLEKLVSGFNLLKNRGFSSVFSIVQFSYPPQRGLILHDESINMQNSNFIDSRSQDLEPIFHDAGQFYFFDVAIISESRTLFTENTGAVVLSELEVQDIDNITDWKLAELKYKFKAEH